MPVRLTVKVAESIQQAVESAERLLLGGAAVLGVEALCISLSSPLSVPSTVTNRVTPQFAYSIVFNDVTSIRYNLAISPCKNSADNSRSVFIVVISAPENRESRDKIRQTWKKHVEQINRIYRNSDRNCPLFFTIEFAFVLGPTRQTHHPKICIMEESAKYKDILQISDTQEFPSYVTMSGVINWIYTRGYTFAVPKSIFYLKSKMTCMST